MEIVHQPHGWITEQAFWAKAKACHVGFTCRLSPQESKKHKMTTKKHKTTRKRCKITRRVAEKPTENTTKRLLLHLFQLRCPRCRAPAGGLRGFWHVCAQGPIFSESIHVSCLAERVLAGCTQYCTCQLLMDENWEWLGLSSLGNPRCRAAPYKCRRFNKWTSRKSRGKILIKVGTDVPQKLVQAPLFKYVWRRLPAERGVRSLEERKEKETTGAVCEETLKHFKWKVRQESLSVHYRQD